MVDKSFSTIYNEYQRLRALLDNSKNPDNTQDFRAALTLGEKNIQALQKMLQENSKIKPDINILISNYESAITLAERRIGMFEKV